MSIEISKRLVLVNSFAAVLRSVLGLAVVFWLQRFLGKKIPESEFAVYSVVLKLMMFVPLVSMAVGGGLTRFVTEAVARGDQQRVTQIVSTLAPLCAGAGLFVLLTGSALSLWIDHVLTIDPVYVSDAQVMFFLLVVLAAIRIGAMPFQIGVQVRQKFVWMHVIGLASQLFWVAGLVMLLVGVSPRALWVAVASVPSTLLEVGLTVWLSCLLMPSLRWRFRDYRRTLVRPLLSFGSWTLLGRVASVARESCGVLILNELPVARAKPLRDAAVFQYTMGATVESKVFPMALIPLSTTLPALTAMHATGQADRLRHAFFRIMRYVLWAFLLPTVPLVAYGHAFWDLYIGPDKYATECALVMMLLLSKSVVVFPQPVLAQIVAARDQTRPMAIRVCILEIMNVLSALVAVIWFDAGAVGVAAVTSAMTLVSQPLLLWTFGFELTGSTLGQWLRQVVLPGLIPMLAAAPVCFGLAWFAPPQSWFTLVLQSALGCSVFAAVLVFFCLTPHERSDLSKVLARAKAILPGRSRA